MVFGMRMTDRHVFSISDDRSLRVWNTFDGRELASGFGHSARPLVIELSGERSIYTGGSDKLVCFWELDNASHLHLKRRVPFDGGPIRSLGFFKDSLVIMFRRLFVC